MSSIKAVQVVLCSLVSFTALGAESVPKAEELDQTPPERRTVLINKWANSIPRKLDPKELDRIPLPPGTNRSDFIRNEMAKAGPGPEWQPIAARLAKIPNEDPKLVQPSLYLFRRLNQSSPECIAFCQAILRSENREVQMYRAQAVDLLSKIGAVQEAAKAAAQILDSGMELRVEQLQPLKSQPEVKAVLLKQLDAQGTELKRAALNLLPELDLTKDEAWECLVKIAKGLSQSPMQDKESYDAFYYSLLRNPSAFKDVGEGKDRGLIAACLDSKEPLAVSLATCLLLITCPDIGKEDVLKICKAYSSQAESKGSGILLMLGYLKKMPFSAEELSFIMEEAKKHKEGARTGLYSLWWRSGGDYKVILNDAFDSNKMKVACDKDYQRGFLGFDIRIRFKPDRWKQIWTNSFKGDGALFREHVVRSVGYFPENPEATWVLEQAAQNAEVDSALLEILWHLRDSQQKLAAIPKLEGFLSRLAGGPSETAAHKAMALLAMLYGKKERVEELAKIIAPTDYWNSALDAMIAVDPKHPSLDEFRSRLAETRKKRPEAAWRCWMLDKLRGREAGELPMQSLYAAFDSDTAINWVVALGQKDDLKIDEVRNVLVPFGDRSPTASNSLMLLGILDRLEVLKSGKKIELP